jgi:5'-nucleotidase / UDP-sugar diphosphatase
VTRSLRFAASLLTALALAVGVPLASAQTAAKTVPLTILHTNDTHGHLLPFSYSDSEGRGLKAQGLTTYVSIGGIARRATLVKQIRRQQQARNIPVWVVDVGDYSDGTFFSTEYHGEADVAAMNAVGYDLGTLGNHEFNNSAPQLRKLIAATTYQLVAANVTDRATGQPLVRPFVIRNVSGVRVAVFGLVTHEAATYPAGKEAFDVANEIESARATVEILKPQSDIIVLLSHAGEATDRMLAKEVPDIDVIVGGHSHSRLPFGEPIERSKDLPAEWKQQTEIVQAHQWGGELGRLDLVFEQDAKGAWRVARGSRASLIPVTSKFANDPAVAAVVTRFYGPIFRRYGEVIGKAAGEFSTRGNDEAQYNLVADAVRETFGTDFAMENMGGVRAPLLKGDITLADLVTVDPFNNTVVLFKATGREVREILERRTPAVSGLKYRVENGKLVEVTIGGRPLEDDKTYSGATNSYFAGAALKGMTTTDTGKPRLDTLIAYIRKKGTVAPAYDGRRVVPVAPRG